DLGDDALAGRTYRRLRPYAGQHHWVLMDRALGALAVHLGEWAAAIGHLDEAERAARRGGILPELALTLATRAALHHRRCPPGRAHRLRPAPRPRLTARPPRAATTSPASAPDGEFSPSGAGVRLSPALPRLSISLDDGARPVPYAVVTGGHRGTRGRHGKPG